jgi:hypothetical protein
MTFLYMDITKILKLTFLYLYFLTTMFRLKCSISSLPFAYNGFASIYQSSLEKEHYPMNP